MTRTNREMVQIFFAFFPARLLGFFIHSWIPGMWIPDLGEKGGILAKNKAIRSAMRRCITEALEKAKEDGFVLEEEEQGEDKDWLLEGKYDWAKQMEGVSLEGQSFILFCVLCFVFFG